MTGTMAAGELLDALGEADRRTLAAVVTHLTGDSNAVSDPSDRVALVRLAAQVLPPFVAGERRVGPLDNEVLETAMSLAAGGHVPAKYGPFVREQMGISPAASPVPIERDAPLTIAIIGAGVTGLALGASLDRVGLHDYTILERWPDVGGTWWLNRYPGCRVDTPSLLYSYSFNVDPGWPDHFSYQPALLQYMKSTASGLGGRIRTGVTVERLVWEEGDAKWRVYLRPDGGPAEQMLVDIVLGATGFLSAPRMPVIAGMDDFKGKSFHSSNWDASLDIQGKRIAVIGTGASANQIVPAISKDAANVSVFQRTPHWVMPHPYYGMPLTGLQRYLIERVPTYKEWFRFRQFWVVGDGILNLMRIDPMWPNQEQSVNSDNETLRQSLTAYIKEHLGDRSDLVRKATPKFPPYAKRMVIDNGWYAALLRPNVELIADPITRITADGIETEDGLTDVDVIVYATGFHTNQVMAPIEIVGRGGVDVRARVQGDPEAYYGIALQDCPNLFMTSGPNGVTVHGGAGTLLAEIQCSYIIECLRHFSDIGARSMEVRASALAKFSKDAALENAKYVWSHSGVTNWYDANSKGASIAFPWPILDFWREAKQPNVSAFSVATAEEDSHLERQTT
jgi:4-hydroxyacetophenone monooxygenase